MASSAPSSSSTGTLESITAKSAALRTQIATEIDEADDPLALYDQFVKWATESCPQELLPHCGLLEVLDEVTRKFQHDASYRSDLRYTKMWILYASLVDKPAMVFKHVLTLRIGAVYAQLYEEYALSLERAGRFSDANQVFTAGIQRKARPTERLKKRYELFKQRTSAKPPAPPPKPTITLPKIKGTPEADMLRKSPLKNHEGSKSGAQVRKSSSSSKAAPAPPSTSAPTPSGSSSSLSASTSAPLKSTSTSSTPAASSSVTNGPYAAIFAPPPPGKRPEKLRFELALLLTKDGKEYSMPEARARTMGLLGKKWQPPSLPKLSASQWGATTTVAVKFDDDDDEFDENRTSRTNAVRRKSMMPGDTTFTINTKEALADVFGMYNSPEKTQRLPGSKHAPVRKIEPVTPINLMPQTRPTSSENAAVAGKTPAFKPFVDENAGSVRRENTTPALSKFKPFVDPENAKTPAMTPDMARKALTVKTTAPLTGSKLRPKGDENAAANVFSKTIPPVSKQGSESPVDIFVQQKAPATQTNITVFRATTETRAEDPAAPKPATFTPFKDVSTPFKVFSRPTEENASTRPPAFKPFVDSENSAPPARAPLASRQPLRPFTPSRIQGLEEEVEEDEDEDSYFEEGRDENDNLRPAYDEDDTDDGHRDRGAPLGGRFGQFDVMTPITERTFEFTSSSRLSAMGNDHSSGLDKAMLQSNAVEAAERLAAELREDEEAHTGLRQPVFTEAPTQFAEEGAEDLSDVFSSFEAEQAGKSSPGTDFIEEKTGTLSLVDAIAVAHAFQPPNPCNPFDPPIISTLLSLMKEDPAHHDMVKQESKLLDGLQKFARKQERRASGNTTLSRMADDVEPFPVRLGDRRFAVYEKLGEGGFGAVFAAKDVTSVPEGDDDFIEDEDEDDVNRVALKVVKPRSIWEFHVLRKLHSSLPQKLQASVIRPHALYAFRDESFLILDLCTQGTLLDIINNSVKAGVSQQGACLDELLVMFFTIELLRLLEGMHTAGFIHGDLKIDNCLVRLEDVPGGVSAWASGYEPSGACGWASKGIKLIDFGRTIDTRMFPHTQTFIAEWPTDARDCFEMREGRPWTYQADYFGLAGIVYCMLFGRYIEAASVVPVPQAPGRVKLATPFKRYWQTELWTRFFDMVLNPRLVRPNGSLPIASEMAAMRSEMEAWLKGNCNRSSNTLKGLLKKVELYAMRGD